MCLFITLNVSCCFDRSLARCFCPSSTLGSSTVRDCKCYFTMFSIITSEWMNTLRYLTTICDCVCYSMYASLSIYVHILLVLFIELLFLTSRDEEKLKNNPVQTLHWKCIRKKRTALRTAAASLSSSCQRFKNLIFLKLHGMAFCILLEYLEI